MKRKYASKSSVPVENSKIHIEKELSRFGASGFVCGWQKGKTIIGFCFRDKTYRFEIQDYEDPQEARTHFRALFLYIKSNLVWVEDGYSSFEEVFLSNMVTNKGETVGEVILPQLEQAQMPRLLTM